MRYYLDTEFDGHGGPLISLALVREDGESLYIVYQDTAIDPWVQENVIPILSNVPNECDGHKVACLPRWSAQKRSAHAIAHFFYGDPSPLVFADWPVDIAYLCNALITGPGEMAGLTQGIGFHLSRVDAYPTTLPGAVRHNAWWDAMALRHALEMPPRGEA